MSKIYCPECKGPPKCSHEYEIGSGQLIADGLHEHQTYYSAEELSEKECLLLEQIKNLRSQHAVGSKVRFVADSSSFYDEDDVQWAEVICHISPNKIRLRQKDKIFDVPVSKVYQVRSHY